MVDAAVPSKTRMTMQEFLALPESNTFVELIDGEVVMSPSPFHSHQKIAIAQGVFLFALF